MKLHSNKLVLGLAVAAMLSLITIFGTGLYQKTRAGQSGAAVASAAGPTMRQGYIVTGETNEQDATASILTANWTRRGDATGWREDQTYFTKDGLPLKRVIQICVNGEATMYNIEAKIIKPLGKCEPTGSKTGTAVSTMGRTAWVSTDSRTGPSGLVFNHERHLDAETGAILYFRSQAGSTQMVSRALSFTYTPFDRALLSIDTNGWAEK